MNTKLCFIIMNNYESMETGTREDPAVLAFSAGQLFTERKQEQNSIFFKQNLVQNETTSS